MMKNGQFVMIRSLSSPDIKTNDNHTDEGVLICLQDQRLSSVPKLLVEPCFGNVP